MLLGFLLALELIYGDIHLLLAFLNLNLLLNNKSYLLEYHTQVLRCVLISGQHEQLRGRLIKVIAEGPHIGTH